MTFPLTLSGSPKKIAAHHPLPVWLPQSKQHARERMQMDREASVKERDQVQEQMSAAQTVIIQLKEEVAAKQEVVSG